jgi:hypothetical protein
MYVLLATTYYLRDRKRVLVVNFLATISIGIAYVLLDAWSGFAMCIVGIVRNIIFIIDEKKKVTLDKVINDFDQKITSKRNQAKRIGHLIGAERLNMEDILTEELNGDKTASNQDEVRKIGFTSTDTKKTSKK